MRKQSTLILLVLLSTNWLLAQIPAGYYTSADGQAGASLKTALFNIIKGHTQVSYTPGVWNAFYTTDKKANGKVWDMYSDVPGGTPLYEYALGTDQGSSSATEGCCYNREHSFPKSWFGDVAPMNVDIFHLYPTDVQVNSRRSNYPYGTVSSPTWTSKNGSKLGPCSAEGYSGTVFEPINEYKGDFARTYFYMVTRYQDVVVSWYSNTEAKPVLNATTYPCFNPWFLKLLLAWNAADPVSPKEISRNDAVYAIQHNRNPFIDHPEYVTAIWGGTTILPQPTNHVLAFTISAKISSAITLTWNDNDGSQPAGKFLILANTTGVFTSPSDGIAYADDINMSDNIGAINVNHGVQSYTWTGLTANTPYYFMIWPYTNTAADADYKTDGTVPAVNGTTPLAALITAAPVVLNGFSYVSGTGASASQSYLLSGVGLSPAAGNVNVTGTADFEVSTNNTTFNSSFALAYSN